VAPNPVNIVGTYTLTSVNGHTLPDTILTDASNPGQIIIAGYVTIAANHVYSGSLTTSNFLNIMSMPLTGDYIVSKYTLTFQDAVFAQDETGSWHGNTIVWDYPYYNTILLFTRDTVAVP
jgi:hypothetical protein